MSKPIHHVLVWIGIYVIYTIMLSFHNDTISMMLLNLFQVAMYMVAYYLLRYVQIPFLYDRKKIGLFSISLIISTIFVYGLYRGSVVYFLDGVRGFTKQLHYDPMADYLVKVIRFYSPAMALLALESHFKGKKEKERILHLEKEKLANELKFLKAQINPHFLFNTLNNLYSHVLTESPKAPDMILYLSGILDYVLYQSQHKTVPLNDEVKTIENFLSLEQIRYGERLEVTYKTDGDLTILISPLILLSIVENAFKHGASGDIDEPKINIHIFEKDKNIHCEVWNTKSQHTEEPKDNYKEVVGIPNIKRQLDLVYPNHYDLIINDLEKSFKVTLKINPS